MSKKKKNGRKKHTVEKLLLATAILELIEVLMEIIRALIE